MLKVKYIVAAVIFLVSFFAQAQDAKKNRSQDDAVTISSTIKGNQEQPNEFYVVPWKSAVDRTILYQTLDTRLESVFGHIERREHIRQLDLINSLTQASK